MPNKVKRYLKSSRSAKKMKLPEDLSFLKGISFFAISEHTKGNKKEFSIEFQPRSIKNIITKANAFNKLNRDVQDYIDKIEDLEDELKKKQTLLNLLSSNYDLVPKKVDKKIDPKHKSPKNYINVMQEKNYPLQFMPFQGGHPSLGKKK